VWKSAAVGGLLPFGTSVSGTAPAQIAGAKISVCPSVGGMFAASGTIIISNAPP
jgi:hypothetical protein